MSRAHKQPKLFMKMWMRILYCIYVRWESPALQFLKSNFDCKALIKTRCGTIDYSLCPESVHHWPWTPPGENGLGC